ncbi:MAG TPA: hypothetical protein ENK50_06585, partial [Sedimenticola sp.]|nr:hypothetical protein [Sedimenticola sp.]
MAEIDPTETTGNGDRPPFRPLRLVLVVLAVILGISWMARWYGGNVIMPRYCEDPGATLSHVRRLLTEKRPAGDGDRKPFIIAAQI